ncbi:uncharacterized protein VTP21DRAFT_8001 [Calcarisporiella thermophila]|uniref:uncharacterized protein n=1 Tax=Calcarisporiella thermophila TaxID=911321 RepID=UPI0037427ECD
MSQPEVHQLDLGPVTAHAFNGDRTQVAVSQNSNVVYIYRRTPQGGWQQTDVLTEHDKLVTCLDWAPNSNRLVTCSQDRNAYVWNLIDGKWRPTLVLLRINRAATYVRWSPLEDKFAVASGSRVIAICHFEEGNDWWISKHLKKPIRSTVLSLDWHPNNVLLAAGCADMKARVFSAYIRNVDKKPAPTVWGDKLPFNTVCGEFANGTGGWIHGVAFSPDGNALAFTGHDSTITVVYPSGDGAPAHSCTVSTPYLPCVSLTWVSPQQIVAVGHDCNPMLLETRDGRNWEFARFLDEAKRKSSMLGSTAFNKFRQMDSRAQVASANTDLHTVHQNTITMVRKYATSGDRATQISTSGVDGRLVVWSL